MRQRSDYRCRPRAAVELLGKLSFNVEVTGAARLYRAASVWTAGLGVHGKLARFNSIGIAILIAQLTVTIAIDFTAQSFAVAIPHAHRSVTFDLTPEFV